MDQVVIGPPITGIMRGHYAWGGGHGHALITTGLGV